MIDAFIDELGDLSQGLRLDEAGGQGLALPDPGEEQ
jgi:hypothetical protein